MIRRWLYVLGILVVCLSTLVQVTLAADRYAKKDAVESRTIQSRSDLASPNIVVIVVDTLRIDHVSAYGYGRATTPNLDTRVANEGVRFNANTVSPWTCPSNAALMTGRFPSTLGTSWDTMGTSVPANETTLAEYLQGAGYYTAGFTSRPYCVRGNLGFSQGFDHYDDGVLTGIPTQEESILAETLNSYIFNWLDTTWTSTISGTQPLYLFAYYFDPHTWYDPPAPYDILYDPTYTGTVTAEIFGHGETAKSGELVLSARDVEHLLALYDGEITYWDAQLGMLLDKLESLGLLDNTLLVVTADHGEMFGEHGEWSHAGSLYEEVVQVPLLMRYSGVITPGLQISTAVQSMDLMPTILDYTDITPTTSIQAISLRPLISGQTVTPTRAIYSEVDAIRNPASPLYWVSPPDDLRSVRQDNWKYIAHLLTPQADELYQLEAASPYEQENLVLQEPEKAQVMYWQVLGQFFPSRVYLPLSIR